MIQLVTGSNIVTLSLFEKATIVNPEYVFVFINDNTYKKVACTASYTELDGNRQQFTLVVGVDDNLNGKVLLDDYGSFSYYVYEIVSASLFDYANINTTDIRTLDNSVVSRGGTKLVENGKAWWTSPTVTNIYYKDVRSSIVTNGN